MNGLAKHKSVPLDAYFENGVLIYRNLVSEKEIMEIRLWLQRIIDWGREIPADFEAEFEPGSDLVRKVRRLYWNDPQFWRPLLEQSGVALLAQDLVGSPVSLIFHACFFKTSRIGSSVALHQDQALWKYQYPNAISIWVAVTPAKSHNGCLIGCPSSHTRGAIVHRIIPENPWHPAVDWRDESIAAPVHYELEPGDAVAWHRYFVHGSGPNESEDPRWGVVMVFADRTRSDFAATDRADF